MAYRCDRADHFHIDAVDVDGDFRGLQIREGADADLVVVDMRKEWIINPDKFKSKAKYSPFEGLKVKGMPVMTIVRGNVVLEEGEILKNQGKFIYG